MDEEWTFTGILDKGWRSHEVGPFRAGLLGAAATAARRRLDGDGKLSSGYPGFEVAHGVGDVVQPVASVDVRRHHARLDELGEPFEVAGPLLGNEVGHSLAHKR